MLVFKLGSKELIKSSLYEINGSLSGLQDNKFCRNIDEMKIENKTRKCKKNVTLKRVPYQMLCLIKLTYQKFRCCR